MYVHMFVYVYLGTSWPVSVLNTQCQNPFIDAYCSFNEIKCSEMWLPKQQHGQRIALVHHKIVTRSGIQPFTLIYTYLYIYIQSTLKMCRARLASSKVANWLFAYSSLPPFFYSAELDFGRYK